MQTESQAVTAELTAMTWETIMHNHPDRRDEIHSLWHELEETARRILADPDSYRELMRRVRQGASR